MSEALLTIKDVQKRLRISERTVFTLMKRGELTGGFKVSNTWRFRESDIVAYEERQRRKAEGLHNSREISEDAMRPLLGGIIPAKELTTA